MQPQSRNHAITDNSDNPDNKGASAVTEQAAKAADIRCEKAIIPAEFAPGIPPMSGEFNAPLLEIIPRRRRINRITQALNNQPAIEGWHQRLEWLDAAALTKRANFASDQLGDAHKPGVRDMATSTAGPDGVPRIPARTASASDARQSRNHTITAIIPITPTTREQTP